MADTESKILAVLGEHISALNAKCVLQIAAERSQATLDDMSATGARQLTEELCSRVKLFVSSDAALETCRSEIRRVVGSLATSAESERPIQITVSDESDIVTARTLARNVCERLGFSGATQIKVATAVSELSRNALQYAGAGTVTVVPLVNGRRGIEVIAHDEGPGIANLEEIMGGDYRSKTGMGMGLLGAKRLMDEFDIDTGNGRGTTVTVRKYVA